MKYCIVTGSGGLVGSESVKFFCDNGYTILGVDNDMRKYFFGTSTTSISDELQAKYQERYIHHTIDIRNKDALDTIFSTYTTGIECIIHCAAQPSHDWAAKEPHTDFGINAVATLNLLELTRQYCPKASFIFMSTNKVYGDRPNFLPLKELDLRYEIEDGVGSIDETMSLDQCKHSIFGASKVAADIMVQEYGRYFGMNTAVFRGGCITGPNHQGAALHGFLSYIVKCIVTNAPYKIFGYKGKQVRDNIHSFDLVNAFWHYHQNPKPAAVYNMGGGRDNSVSILETIQMVNTMTGKSWTNYEYVDEARSGDHIWYISDLTKFKTDYPGWTITYPIKRVLKDILCAISPNTVTASMLGGIGNQLFQIAVAYAMSRELNCHLKFQKNQFGGCRQGSHPSTYYNNIYQKLDFVDNLQVTNNVKEKGWEYQSITEDVNNTLRMSAGDATICLEGYFQSDKYFKAYSSEIKDLFTPKGGIVAFLEANSTILTRFPELKQPNDFAFIGIRRGDYVTYANVHNPCGMTYYNMAMDRMKKEKYYILTDDFEWARAKFVGDQYIFLDNIKEDIHQLFTISLFKNYIMSNSTFYWWGSFLSVYPEPQIIAPDKWIFGPHVQKHQYWSVYRDGMHVLERPVETD